MAITDDEKARLTAVTALYNEQCAHGRHTETQRATLTTILLSAAGVLVGLIGTLKFSIHCIPVTFALISTGLLGRRFVEIYEQKWEETSDRRNFYRGEMETIGRFGTPTVVPNSSKKQLRRLWRHAFSGVVIFGIACLVLTIALSMMRTRHGEDLMHQLAPIQPPDTFNHAANLPKPCS